jgi:hypothetical protein
MLMYVNKRDLKKKKDKYINDEVWKNKNMIKRMDLIIINLK